MRIGVPKEVKDSEERVALTPEGVRKLAVAGHQIRVQTQAGVGSGFSDDDYQAAGATMVGASESWAADLVLKIKEPVKSEFGHLGQQILFTYLHLSGVTPSLTEALLDAGTTAVAYETVEDHTGRLPLLTPMSAVAGTMATTVGAYYLARAHGGKGTLLGWVLGERSGKVLVIGDGVVGRHAARVAAGLGAQVSLAGRHQARIPDLEREIGTGFQFVQSTEDELAEATRAADLVVGGVLLRGGKAPYVVSEPMVEAMERGSVIVDVSIDQGGCVATSRPTTHSDPVYEEHGVTHYCVTNMPGAYPRTSTLALTRATFPYALALAEKGEEALRDDPGFAKAVNVREGAITCRPVAEALEKMDRFRNLTL